MDISRDELLQVTDVAYGNIVETGIGGELSGAGYTEERRLAAVQRAADLKTKRQAQQVS